MTYSKLFYHSNQFNFHPTLASFINQNVEVRIGSNYQVEIPDYQNVLEADENDRQDESILLWQPNADRIDDQTLDVYLKEVKNKYGFDSWQALTVLFKFDYNIKEALNQICHNVT